MRTPHRDMPEKGHPWNRARDVHFGDLALGMKLIADDGFTCIPDWMILDAQRDECGWYVDCMGEDEGPPRRERHYLDGQRDHTYGTDIVVGFRRVVDGAAH